VKGRMTLVRTIGRLVPTHTAVFLCDMQVKFRPMISYFDGVVSNSSRVLCAAKHMDIPVLATEQYPKGLGPTVPEVGLDKYGVKAHPKTSFSMVLPELMKELREKQEETKSVILCGIETQACIHHTTLDLLDLGIEVHIPVDCCSSRSMVDRKVGLERLRQAGAFLTTSECCILSLAPDSNHPKFRGLQKLVMEQAVDTGL